MSDCQCRRPEILALLAAMSRDWDAVRLELDLLPEDDLTALRHASGDLDVEIGYALAQRGCE